ncbi:MAG: flippase-like domain-containing protein [Deltaproteobacteria bacterium]|nr:flippase-like domain-containing protein [Deltaproteobacteria bacterium]
MSRGVRIAFSVAISVVALYFAFPPRSEWGHVREAFARVQYVYAVPLMLLSAYTVVIRSQRWRLLLRPLGDVPFLPLFSATCIGFFCNMVLPLRVGEVVRPVLLARRTRLPASSVFGSVLLERLLDMVTILVFLGTVVLLVPVSDTIRRSGIAFLVVAVAAMTLVLALQRRHPVALRSMSGAFRLLPAAMRARADAAMHGFIDGLQGIGGGAALLRIVLYSFYLWLVIASIFGFGLIACGLPVPFMSGALALVAVVAGAVSAPSAPGFIGTFQAGCILALALFGIERADAIPYSFVVWAVQSLAQIVLGVVFLLRENVSFRDIQASEEGRVAASDV